MFTRKLSIVVWLFIVAIATLLSACGGEATTIQTEEPQCPYRLPWSNSLGEVRVTQGYAEPNNRSHKVGTGMEYAIDFALAEGTPVLAARGGTVSKVHDGETVYGGEVYRNNANYVIIDHDDGTFAVYYHLKSSAVREGQPIAHGQVVGYSGKTGWTDGRPHLHFQLQEIGDRFGQSIPLCFQEVEGVPQLNEKYTSQNELPKVLGLSIQSETAPTEEPTVQTPTIVGAWEGAITTTTDTRAEIAGTVKIEVRNCANVLCVEYLPTDEYLPPQLLESLEREKYCFSHTDDIGVKNTTCLTLNDDGTIFYEAFGIFHMSSGVLTKVDK